MRRLSLGLLAASGFFLAHAVIAEEGATARMVSIEIVIAESQRVTKPDDAGKYEVVENITERLKQLERQGQIGAVGRMQLTTLDRFPATIQIGERVPVLAGRTRTGTGFGGDRGGGGPMSSSYSIQNFGTMITVTPTIDPDGSVVLSLEAERSRLVPPPPVAAGAPANDEPQMRTTTVTTRTTIRVSPGQPVLISGAKNVDKDQVGELLIMASARVSGAMPAKVDAAVAPNK